MIRRPAWRPATPTWRSCAGRSTAPYAFEDLFAEARVAVLPRSHPRAGDAAVAVEDLAADAVIADPGPDAVWRAFYTADESAAGPRSAGVEVGSFDEELATVALGRAIAFTSAAAARLYPRPDLAYCPAGRRRPVHGGPRLGPRAPAGQSYASLLAAARRAREQARAGRQLRALRLALTLPGQASSWRRASFTTSARLRAPWSAAMKWLPTNSE